MNIKNGVVDMLKQLGVGVSMTREKEVNITKYEGNLTFKTAVTVNK